MNIFNPFSVADYYSPEYFCNRSSETQSLLNAFKSKRNVTILAIRKLGKTGLIKHLFHKIASDENKKTRTLYIDIFKTQDLLEFIREFSSKIIEDERVKLNWVEKVSKLISSLKASISFDEFTGIPSLSLAQQDKESLERSLDAIFQYLANQEEEYLIAFDEFQQITNYPEKNVEAILRTYIQNQHKDSYIFSGSSKHILISMFSDYGRPFYQSSEILHLGKLDLEEYSNFIKDKFEKVQTQIEINDIKEIVKNLDIHTYYVQYFFNKLFEKRNPKITFADMKLLLENILKENEYIYLNYRNLLTPIQFRMMRAVALEGEVSSPNSSSFIKKYDFSQPSTVNTTLKALVDKEMIYHENGVYKVYDVFMKKWFQHILK